MSDLLHSALRVVLLVVVLGFTVWVLIRALKRSDDAAGLVFKWVFTAGLMALLFFVAVPQFKKGGLEAMVALGLTGLWGLAMTLTWRNSLIDLVANPIASLYDGGRQEVEPRPLYSIALAKRKTNRPLEAIVEIRRQLAAFPNDYEGVTLLASIQAEDLGDLPAAEIAFHRFCDRPEAPPKQVAAAFTQLADWHLKMAQDGDSARAALEQIIRRFPGTALAAQAAQRIAHLAGTEKRLMAAQEGQPVAVPEGVRNIGLLDSSEFLRPAEMDPELQAAAYVRQLEQHPHDLEAREALAILYAQHYQRLDLAALELESLVSAPGAPAKRVADALNLLANLQLRGGADYDTVRATLERIVERFPDLPAGEIARSRLSRLRLEFKGQKETPSVKLGVYEQNIGLKYGSPRQL